MIEASDSVSRVRTCDVTGCTNKHVAKGLCERHRWQARKEVENAKRRKPKHTKEQWEQAKRLLEDGASYREVSFSVKIPRTTLRENLPGYGWTSGEGRRFMGWLSHSNKLQALYYEITDPGRRV